MNTKTKVAVVIGRFQVPALHDGHIALLDAASANASKLIIFIGDHAGERTVKDPMDFATRALMLRAAYPQAKIIHLTDHPCDMAWSKNVDSLLEAYMPKVQKTLYGSRQSFIKSYSGIHNVVHVDVHATSISGTEARANVTVGDSGAFRQGVIYAHMMRYPVSYQTVDVAIIDFYQKRILLGRKAHDDGWRFVGGFIDPADKSLEVAAKREALEEVGMIEMADYEYVSSHRVDDHRYRGQRDQILTSLFVVKYIFGAATASDDLDDVRWFPLNVLQDKIIAAHKPLAQSLQQYLTEKGEV